MWRCVFVKPKTLNKSSFVAAHAECVLYFVGFCVNVSTYPSIINLVLRIVMYMLWSRPKDRDDAIYCIFPDTKIVCCGPILWYQWTMVDLVPHLLAFLPISWANCCGMKNDNNSSLLIWLDAVMMELLLQVHLKW